MNKTTSPVRVRRCRLRGLLLAVASSLAMISARADTLTVAVASNFSPALKSLTAHFEATTGHSLRISSASTGMLYAQIINGAPFDVLLAADVRRPELLEKNSLAVRDSRFTYAVGQLVLWSRDPGVMSNNCLDELTKNGSGRIAIANPETAPYGAAARETMIALGAWEQLRERIVSGENIAQALQFVATGNARFGFVAAAQLEVGVLPQATCSWRVPQRYHSVIDQQAVLLMRAAENDVAAEFLDFLRSPVARQIISASGYTLPAS